MKLRPYIIIRNHIDFYQQILILFLGWVSIMSNKNCMREPAISLKELHRYKLKKLNGD